MLKPRARGGHFSYPLYAHPLARVLKFERLSHYLLSLPAGGTVLDYGSGDRPYEEMLLTRFDRYIAADMREANLSHSRRPDVYIDGSSVDLPSSSVDCVILTEVLEHLYRPAETLVELHRLLKPGGRILGTTPFAMNEHEQPYDFHRYTSFCLEKMFADSGYRVLDLSYVGDMVAVAVTTSVKVLQIFVKGLRALRLGPLAALADMVIRVPEFSYYVLFRAGVNPQNVSYFRRYPLGFAFHLEKGQEAPGLLGKDSDSSTVS